MGSQPQTQLWLEQLSFVRNRIDPQPLPPPPPKPVSDPLLINELA